MTFLKSLKLQILVYGAGAAFFCFELEPGST